MLIFQYAPLCMALLIFGFFMFEPGDRMQRAGALLRWGVVLSATAMVLGLFVMFLGRHYEFQYVHQNSSQDLAFIYRFSAVWAGQAGTFLLWYWFTALLLVAPLQPRSLRNPAWAAVGFVLVLIGVFLALESPFALVPHADLQMLRDQIARGMMPASLLNAAGLPTDGQGLNPILQNPWMAIHPPLIFIGYGLAAAPFALAAAAVVTKQPQAWAAPARKWSVVAWAFLGAGIFCGSYWAYIILGWGGYWGWDPVENASLLPWIALAALSHGLIIQGGRKRFGSWNLLLAFLPLVMVFVTTFLTRSGALAEFSVHSFQKSLLYYPIALSLGTILAVSLGFWIFALGKKIVSGHEDGPVKWGPRLLSWTVLLLITLIGFVMLGTLFPLLSGIPAFKSLPIISRLAAGGASTVDPSYYNKTSFFTMFLIAGILLVCPFLFVRTAKGAASGRVRMGAGLVGALAGAGMLAASGPQFASAGIRVLSFVLALMAGALAGINLTNALHFYRLKRWNLGGYTVHAGIGLLVLGVLTTGFGSREEAMRLVPGQTHEGKLAQVTLTNVNVDPQKQQAVAVMDIRRGGKSQTTSVRFNIGQSRRAPTPTILNAVASDLYIIPEGVSVGPDAGAGGMPHAAGGMEGTGGMGGMDMPPADMPDGETVTRTQSVRAGQSELLLLGWDLSDGGMQQGTLTVVLQVTDESGTHEIKAPFNAMGDGTGSSAITLADGTTVRVLRINVNKRQPEEEFAVLEVTGPQSRAPRTRSRAKKDPYLINASYTVAQAPAEEPATPQEQENPHNQMPADHPPMPGADSADDSGAASPHPPMSGMGEGMGAPMGDMSGMSGMMPPGHPPAAQPRTGTMIQIRIITKPFIALIWLGMIFITIGAFAASMYTAPSQKP